MAGRHEDVPLFIGVQIDLTFDPGIGLGRYLVERARDASQLALASEQPLDDRGSDVLVVSTAGAPLLPDRRGLARRPRRVARALATEDVWLHQLTFVRGDHVLAGRREAEAALAGLTEDVEASARLVQGAFDVAKRAMLAARVADGDPHALDLHPGIARAVRLGIGTADEIAAGQMAVACAVAPSPVLRWHEQLPAAQAVAAALSGRSAIYDSDVLMLRIANDVAQQAHARAAAQLPALVEIAAAEFAARILAPEHLDLLRADAREIAGRGLSRELDRNDQQRTADLVRRLWELAQAARQPSRRDGRRSLDNDLEAV